jgi:hypothetical protein
VKKYRFYIDESGTHSYSKLDEPGERFLALTGLIIEDEVNRNHLQPLMKDLRTLISNDPDNLPLLHRSDIVRGEKHFIKLRDPLIKVQFEKTLEELFTKIDYTICTVVLDKQKHISNYQGFAKHPYHYCLELLLERYEKFLRTRGIGDVMAESRGKKEDFNLKMAYSSFYYTGTSLCKPELIQKVFTSKQIKLENKHARIDGLVFADLIAHPSKMEILDENGIIKKNDDYGKKVIGYIQSKYFRDSWYGSTKVVKGFGKKLIPTQK